uniref:inositol-1,4-bisphosphate 1-phosphatase n=1 Tax=Cacopsylla melanoneura TaxID=428564 RepID=A0A8D8ZZA9_9HEMI
MDGGSLLKEILVVSEKAANIARVCRQDQHLLRLLTQEKGEEEKNKRFDADFKTLADVLIQEVVKHHLGTVFPLLKDNIHGEESNVFTNATGESIVVNISSDPAITREALVAILNGDSTAAEALIDAVYSEPSVPLDGSEMEQLPEVEVTEDVYGVWIDPIDSTAEYINGNLSCALVLIGVFNKSDGTPVLGVVNQPFYEQTDGSTDNPEVASSWTGRVYWGVCEGGSRHHSKLQRQEFKRETLNIAVSSSENTAVRDCLLDNGYEILPLPGAGYKILSVILNKCDLYLCSKPSTYVWDTLACHAILKSMTTQGGIVECRLRQDGCSKGLEEDCERSGDGDTVDDSEGVTGIVDDDDATGNIVECGRVKRELTYARYEDRCNRNGLVAFRDVEAAERVLKQIEHLLPR